MAIFLWLSKKIRNLSIWLTEASEALTDQIEIKNKKIQDNRRITQQNINAENKLQNITGETSHAVYTRNVRQEIDELIKEIGSASKS